MGHDSTPHEWVLPSLADQLASRAARGFIGALRPASDPLRKHLTQALDVPPGIPGGFIADPVIEAVFDWETRDVTMDDLVAQGLLSRATVDAVAAEDGLSELAEYRFPRDREPYSHQIESWRHLLAEDARSVLVRSGTGSGKTECFLIPVLDELARAQEAGPVVGVRALFLYPLNALINSQRDRLRAWCSAFGDRVRFCLYKGDTPASVPSEVRRRSPAEVLDRRTLRRSPPPILVTNSTMLEYMLVRREDRPLLDLSSGLLRWVILDEAHTYLGSQAAETALLLRRVMHSFGVRPDDVRFVATSATIGSDDDESQSRLRTFLAMLAGVSEEAVYVVTGRRKTPPLPSRFHALNVELPSTSELARMPSEERFERLASCRGVREARRVLLEQGPQTATALASILAEDATNPLPAATALQVVDMATEARIPEGEALLRVRAHYFHRTHDGTWACVNPACPGRAGTALDTPAWPFGRVYFERRTRCDSCGSVVLDVVLCSECGADYLLAQRGSAEGVHRIAPCEPIALSESDEYRELVGVEDEDESAKDSRSGSVGGAIRLLTAQGANGAQPLSFSAESGEMDGDAPLIRCGEVVSQVPDGHLIRCLRCGGLERSPGERFRHARLGGAFFLRGLAPLMLQHTSPESGQRGRLPSDGRRLISFTDSRQGTARFALDAQLDAERNYIRSWLYHQVVARRADEAPSPKRIEELEENIAALEAAPPSAAKDRMLRQWREELAALGADQPGRLPWSDALTVLASQREVANWMRAHWNNVPLGSLDQRELADFFLIRELGRRPRNQNSLETLGLACLEYPKLDVYASAPDPWRERGLPKDEWRAFLKIAMDYVVRGYSALEIDRRYIRWFGAPLHPHVLVGPDSESDERLAIRWPTTRSSRRGRLVQLLSRALGAALDDAQGRADIDQCLRDAWEQVRPLLSSHQGGYVLRPGQQVEIREVTTAWQCPVTRRVLDTTLLELTPYLTPSLTTQDAHCRPLTMPRLPLPFWRRDDGNAESLAEVAAWLQEDPSIAALRDLGIWTDISDRIASLSAYYQVGEHSAQQTASRLRELERLFKEGRLNLLSCSTTMELGVDIGGLGAVAMTNAPPSPANYVQRAGRAGRRGETRAFSVTVCRSSPHEEQVFQNPTWPFRSRSVVPDVGLRSERIVQRHANALLLARFFQTQLSQRDLPKLHVGAFFEPPEGRPRTSICGRLEAWLQGSAIADEWVSAGLHRLVRYSPLEGVPIDRLLSQTANQVATVRERWIAELEPLLAEEQALQSAGAGDPARRAVELRLRRMREEYLLREITTRGFLPGHGFPTHVVPLVTTTVEDLKRRDRRDGDTFFTPTGLSQGYPSRDVSLALRDYAPGNSVVLDGRVLRSHGVTLNWHIPAGDAQVPEIQALRWAWRCRRCGNAGISNGRPEGCASETCQGSDAHLDRHSFLQPAGFAVDLFYEATNDLTDSTYLPVEEPWIAAGGQLWQSLSHPDLGRFRYAPEGTIFHYSRGVHGHGYAVCLKCGRADSETEPQGPLPEAMAGHRPLRGGRETNAAGRCKGTEEPWSIQRRLWMGAARETDVLELRLFHVDTGEPVQDQHAASAVAVALRQALAERIGVEDRDISWATRPAREDGRVFRTIVLLDAAAGGAGYVAQAPRHLPQLLRRARQILECPRRCDLACHACLLTYDTRHAANELDRMAALRVLNDAFLDSLELPQEAQCFGTGTELELEALDMALTRETSRWQQPRLRFWVGGDATSWDLDEWLVSKRLSYWKVQGTTVELAVLESTMKALDDRDANRLSAWAEADLAVVLEAPEEAGALAAGGRLLVEVGDAGGSTRFAVLENATLSPGEGWGTTDGSLRVLRGTGAGLSTPEGARLLRAEELFRKPGAGTSTIPIHSECDGPIREFGARLWSAIEKGAPQWAARLRTMPALKRIRYQDRYLHSPLAVRLMSETLGHLCNEVVTLQADGVAVEIVTAELSRHARPGNLVWHDWQSTEDRREVLTRLLKPIGRLNVDERRRAATQHARELTLVFEDGSRLVLHLDQGFGFMGCRGEVRYPFREEARRQASSLAEADFWVQGRGKSFVYVIAR